MFKQSRFFFSVSFIAVLLISLVASSSDVSAKTKRCPVEMPKPLLTLYLQSDLVVIADIADEKIQKVESENSAEENFYYDVERRLDVIEVFKGQKLKEITFSKTEYRPNPKQTESIDETDEVYLETGYGISAKLEKGKRYLFFFKKDEEAGFYATDYRSGAREITSENSLVLEKRLDELGKIVAAKKNRIAKLAEWLVRLTEERETRWDGATTLSRSFSGMSSESEEADETTFTADENFDEYSPALAKAITDSQMQRLSDIFTASLNEHFFGKSEDSDYDYTMAQLVGNWDRTRMATYGFGILQSIDRSNLEKTAEVMNFVSDMASDNQLYEIYYEFNEAIRQNEETENVAETEVKEEIAQTENEPRIDESEIRVETNKESTAETNEAVEEPESETEKVTPAQIREQIMQKFVARYQQLLARNFEPEAEAEKIYAEIIK